MQSKIGYWQFWASRATLLIMVSAVFPGCGATMKPVQPGQRFAFDGISLQPPEGDNWYYTERNDNGFWTLNFNQRIDDKAPGQRIGRSVFLYVESGHFNPLKPGQTQHEQLEEVSSGARSPSEGVRFRDVVNSTTWMHLDGQEAIRVYRVAEDHDHPVESHSMLTMETDFVSCATPAASRRGLLILCSQRWQVGQHPIALKPLTDAFLRSVHFVPTATDGETGISK